jgi:calcineurin-like phosphoesterase family protein
MSRHRLSHNRGTGNRHQQTGHVHSGHGAPAHGNLSHQQKNQGFKSHAAGSPLPVQQRRFVPQHFPFQPLPPPNGQPPFRFDLSQLLHIEEVQKITQAGKLVFHTVGDTGDERGKEMDFVARMMTDDYDASPDAAIPAFFYHLGDVVYFAGDINKYGECFYETYAEYPGLIVSIPGNHDCQPDDPQDGPVDPTKTPLDGWVQNFMSKNPNRLGSLKTTSSRTQTDLPNPYWTLTTPLATIIGLFSNVSETEAELHQDQIDWFKGELQAADTNKALIVTIHHPPFSGDDEHSGSTVAEQVLFESFADTNRYPHLVLSGHVHNYQRFTVRQSGFDVPCVVAGNGGYSKLGKLHKIHGQLPQAPMQLSDTLSLEQYDQNRYGFLRFEITKDQITGIYTSALFAETRTPEASVFDRFTVDLRARKVATTG